MATLAQWARAYARQAHADDWTFPPQHLLRSPPGPTFVKLLCLAINRALDELP